MSDGESHDHFETDSETVHDAELVETAQSARLSGPLVLDDDIVSRVEQAVDRAKRFMSACLKMTHESHWVKRAKPDKQGGGFAFQIQSPGAEALCNPFGIDWQRLEFKSRKLMGVDGEYVEYQCEGTAVCSLLKRSGFFIGTATTRDDFFLARARNEAIKEVRRANGWKRYEEFTPADHAEVARVAPLKINHGDVKKKAMSNWLVNAVSRLLGVRNPAQHLLEDAGLKIDAVPGVEYKTRGTSDKASEKGGRKRSESRSGASPGARSERTRHSTQGQGSASGRGDPQTSEGLPLSDDDPPDGHPASASNDPPDANPDAISEKQSKRVYAIAYEAVKEHLDTTKATKEVKDLAHRTINSALDEYGLESTTHIARDQYNDFCDTLSGMLARL